MVTHEMPPGTVPELAGDIGAAFTSRSWTDADFVFEGYARTSTSGMETSPIGAPSLRETAVVDPPGVQTFATLTPLSLTVMGPPALSPATGTSSSMPPPRPVHEGGTSAFAAAATATRPGPSGSASFTPLPSIPRELLYFGAGVIQYEVPAYPLSSPAQDFLADVPSDAVYLLFLSFNFLYL